MRRRRVATALACTAVLGWQPASGAVGAYPSRPVRIVVPTAAGGGNDAMARIIAPKLAQRLGQPVLVENRAGGNGAIAAEQVSRAIPDGHTILLGYVATHAINPALQKLSYDPVRDFAPIARIAEAPGVVVVTPTLPVRTLADLAAYARARPDVLNYASAGNGTAPHLAAEQFRLLTGTRMTHVAYRGSAPALTDTVSGQVQVMFPSLVAASAHIRAGRLRALAVTGARRSPLFPELPTAEESGVPGFTITQWYGFFAPARTAPEVVERLGAEIAAVMREPDTVRRFAEQGAEVSVALSEEFGRFVRGELARWGELIRAARITAD